VVDLVRTAGHDDLGHCAQLDRNAEPRRSWSTGCSGGVDNELLHLGHGGAVSLVRAHHDVDLLVLFLETGGHVAADLVPDDTSHLVLVQTEPGQALPVEDHVDFRIAHFGGGLDVAESGDPAQGAHGALGEGPQLLQVVGHDFHLDRPLESEMGRPAELVGDLGQGVQLAADPIDTPRLGGLVQSILHHDVDGGGVFLPDLAGELVFVGAADAGKDGGHIRKLLDPALDILHEPIRVLDGGPLRQLDLEGELPLGQGRDQLRAEGGVEAGGGQRDEQRQSDDHNLMVQRQPQPVRVGPLQREERPVKGHQHGPDGPAEQPADPADDAAYVGHDHPDDGAEDEAEQRPDPARDPTPQPLERTEPAPPTQRPLRSGGCGRRRGVGAVQLLRPAEAHRHEHGQHGQGHHQRCQQRIGDGERLVLEQLARDSFHEDQRQKHRHCGQRGRRDGHVDLFRAAVHRFGQLQPRSLVPVDGFEHDDGIVHQHADPQGDPAQRHDVQRQVGLVHQGECGHDRDGYGQTDHQCAAHILEEEKQDDGRQQPAHPGVAAHLADGLLDEVRLIGHDGVAHVGRDDLGFLERGQPAGHGPGDGDGVGVAFLVDRHLDTLAPVEPGDHLAVLGSADHLGDVLQAHLPAPLVADDDPAHLSERFEFIQGADHVARFLVVQGAGGHVQVFALEDIRDLGDRDVQLGELLLVDVDLDLFLEAAHHLDGGHAVHRLQVLLQLLLGEEPEHAQVGQPLQPDAHDGVAGRVEPQDHGFFGVTGQLHEVELLPYIQHRQVHVGVPVEFQDDLGLSRSRDRADPGEAGDHTDSLLDRLRDQVLDFLRRGVGVGGVDGQGRVGDVGQQVERQAVERDDPEQDHRHHEHGHGDGSRDRAADIVHDSLLFVGSCCAGDRLFGDGLLAGPAWSVAETFTGWAQRRPPRPDPPSCEVGPAGSGRSSP